MAELLPTEPVMATYMEKWSKVNLVAHEQERSAREEYSRACIDWQRIEINRLITETQRLREALEQIAEGRGPFSTDQLTFATAVIETMKQTAKDALSALDRSQP